ncbi:MAG: ABC transporter permease [Acidobacteria bacterium]|nr:ABC transporter permease [Acidobacteriota bacterium]
MAGNEIKATLRTFYREKSYALINLLGLSLAIACCLILGLYLRSELTHDRHNEHYRQIYRIANEFTTSGTVDRIALTSISLGPMLKDSYPEIKAYVRLQPVAMQQKVMIRSGDKTLYWQDIYIVDENIFEVFSHKILYGDPRTALKDPASAAVSETFARKYFGNANPIGKVINVDLGEMAPKKISLVFRDLPENTHIKYNALFRLQGLPPAVNPRNMLFGVSNYTYLLLPESYDPDRYKAISESFYSRFMQDTGKVVGISWKSWLEPLAGIHLYSDLSYDLPTGNRYYIYGFAAVAVFILLVACINYVNLATARAARRSKEIGMRKILGAPRVLLILRFLGEAVVFAAAAMAISIGLVEVILRTLPMNELFGKPLTLGLRNEPVLLLWIAGLALLVGLLSGSYPALYLSSISPLSALADSHKGKKGGFRLRELLVLTQFTVSVLVIACTIIMALQMHYISGKPLGFEKQNRVVVNLRSADVIAKYQVMKNELLKNSRILGVSAASAMISTDQIIPHGAPMVDNRDGVQERLVIRNLQVTDDFFAGMGIQMASGRDFSKRLLTDLGTSFIVNETMVKARGWKEPLGKRIQLNQYNGKVIGVVKDFHFRSLHNAMEPLIINQLPDTGNQRVMVLKISDQDVPQTLRFLQQKFAEHDPRHAFEYLFLDDAIDKLYMSESRLMKMTGIFSGICIFISCLGLFGLASYSTEQRSKEIGIRKVLGASAFQIILMLAKKILWLVLAGSVVASVIAYFAIDEWMAGFAYRVGIQLWVFLVSAAVVIAVAFITIALQSYKTAQTNPAQTLRYE